MSHYVTWDRIQAGRKSIAICGDWADPDDIATEPTCPECLAELALTAEDAFGTAASGTPVRSMLGNPLAGYKERTR